MAGWMPPDERDALTQAIAGEDQLKQARGTVTFGSVFRNPRMLHFVAIYFLIQISGYGVAFYLPTQVSAPLGVDLGAGVGLVTPLPRAFALVVGSFCPALGLA